MKINEIKEIHKSLVDLGQERVPFAYEIAVNTKECSKIMMEAKLIFQDLLSKYCDKDENGHIKEYIQDPDKPDSPKVNKITDLENLKMFNIAVKKLDNEEYSPKFINIPKDEIKKYDLPSSPLVALVGVIIC